MDVDGILDALYALLEEEEDFPRTIRDKIETTITTLEKTSDDITVNRVLQELENAAENSNIESHHRMQLFNVVSMLESV